MLSETVREYPNVSFNLFQADNASASPFKEVCCNLMLLSFRLLRSSEEHDAEIQQTKDKILTNNVLFL